MTEDSDPDLDLDSGLGQDDSLVGKLREEREG